MVVVNGYVAKGSDEYFERIDSSAEVVQKRKSVGKKKKYSYHVTNTSAIMTNSFQNIDEDSQLGSLEFDISVNCLDDFEASIIKLVDQKHSCTLKDPKVFKGNGSYMFFSKIPGTKYIYVDNIKINKIEEN